MLVTLRSSVYISDIRILYSVIMFFCSEHFSLNVNHLICGNVSKRLVHNICSGRRTVSSYCNVFELVMLKRNILAVPGCDFTVTLMY